jgi:hypothetical protein
MFSYEDLEWIKDIYMYLNGNSLSLLQVSAYEQKFWNQLCSYNRMSVCLELLQGICH